MKNKAEAIQAIATQGLLPLFYYEDPEVSLAIVRTLYGSGIRVIEYTNRGKAALSNFGYIKKVAEDEMPDLFFGAGTIKNISELQDFLRAGADFIVCPVVDREVGKRVHENGKLWIPGCMTPTEINIAHQLNAGIIKLFPAEILGPSYLASIRSLFNNQFFIPTGGVEIDAINISAWLKSGACAVGMGSKLISKQILDSRDYRTLLEQSIIAQKIINGVRAE